MEKKDIDIFDYNMLLMPFHSQGQTSLFAIVGAKYIRDYTKIGFSKNRPCILHFDPNNSSLSKHDPRRVADRLRTWLNRLWRKRKSNDLLSMPFQKRTMPLCHPIGMVLYTFLHFITQMAHLSFCNYNSSLKIKTWFQYRSLCNQVCCISVQVIRKRPPWKIFWTRPAQIILFLLEWILI